MPRPAKPRLASTCFVLLGLIVIGGVLVSCGGSKSAPPTQVIPNIAGSWEFIAISSGRRQS